MQDWGLSRNTKSSVGFSKDFPVGSQIQCLPVAKGRIPANCGRFCKWTEKYSEPTGATCSTLSKNERRNSQLPYGKMASLTPTPLGATGFLPTTWDRGWPTIAQQRKHCFNPFCGNPCAT